MLQITCPDSALLKGLLDGALAADEQADLSAHLEGCPRCQHTLEDLAAGKETWVEAAQKLSAGERTPEPGLLRVMEVSMKEGPRGAPPEVPPTETPLDFLDPPAEAGHLGRLGRYEVIEVIGRGGMAVVLKALDPGLHRVVAIKVLAPQLATTASARKRFEREGRAAAAVSHEHVVAVHGVAEHRGLPYLVMEYIAGVSLQERLDARGPLGLKEVLRIGMQAARGLAAAHAQGLVHRDIKPANILLHNGVERVKLTDFGLARAVDDASLTRSGLVAGTPQYMAPEQARGEAVDHRADLFSLGSVLYALCAGRPPFRASTTLGVLRRVAEEPARPLREVNPDVPSWFAALVEKLHAKDPAARFASAAELADLLERHLAELQQGSPAALTAAPARSPGGGPRRRRWRVAAALLLAAGAALAVTEATGVTQFFDGAVDVTSPDKARTAAAPVGKQGAGGRAVQKRAPDLDGPDKRWLRAAERPGLSAKAREAYKQIARIRLCAFKQVYHVAGLSGGWDPNGPTEVIYRMGLEVVPQLAEALDDATPTRTVITAGSGKERRYRVNELVGLLIVQIASHDFAPDAKTIPLSFNELGTRPELVAGYHKAIMDWWAKNHQKPLAERKLADVNDALFRNRSDAVRWLAEHKSAAGRQAIAKRVDALLADLRAHKQEENSLVYAELSDGALALGKIGDKASLPQIRRVCQFLTEDLPEEYKRAGWGVPGRWALGGFMGLQNTFNAYQGLALLGEKDAALRELNTLFNRYRDTRPQDEQRDFLDRLDRARLHW
jgi:hypothetical protein